MPEAQRVTHFRHGMAERYEVVIDFSKYTPASASCCATPAPTNNINYANTDKVMAFDVVGPPTSTRTTGRRRS